MERERRGRREVGERELDGREAMRMREQETEERRTDKHKGGREMVSARQSEGLTREQ